MKDDANGKRREFIKKAGKFAIYTPPAIMLMMNPSMKAIAKSGGGGVPYPRKEGSERGSRGRDFNSRMDSVMARLQARIDSIRARFR